MVKVVYYSICTDWYGSHYQVVDTKLLKFALKSLQVGIDCLHHLPGVGSNLQDHLEMSESNFLILNFKDHLKMSGVLTQDSIFTFSIDNELWYLLRDKIFQVRGSAVFPACQPSWRPEGSPHDQGYHQSWILGIHNVSINVTENNQKSGSILSIIVNGDSSKL